MRATATLGCVMSFWLSACVVDVQLEGKACNEEHPCAPGSACQSGRCVSAEVVGQLDGPCYPNGTCDEPLVCLAGSCAAVVTDAGPADAGPVDAGPIDAGPQDAGFIDAGPPDAGAGDAGGSDAGLLDAGELDDGGGNPEPSHFAGFAAGTFTDTALDQGALMLASSAAVGEWVSPVYDAQSASSWTLAWTPRAPYGKPIPDALAESGYLEGSFDATAADAILHLDGFVDERAEDTSGEGNDGACSAPTCPVVQSAGVIDGAVSFDGLASYLALPDVPAGQVTLAAWVWRDPGDDDSQQWTGVISKWSAGVSSDDQWFLGVHEGMHSFWLKGTGGYLSLDTSVPFATGQWVHVAMTYDGAELACYVDGVLVAGASLQEPVNDGSLPVLLGANGPENGRYFMGALDEVLILRRALTPAEVTALRERAGLQAYFQVRGCDEPDCSSQPWLGPFGDALSVFLDRTPGSPPLPVFLDDVIGTRRYAQVRALLGSGIPGRTPRIEQLTLSAQP